MPNIIVDGTTKINSVSINWSIGIGTNWLKSVFTGLFNFIINILLEPSIKKDSKILFPQLIFSLIFILVMVLFVLPYFIFNVKNPIIGISKTIHFLLLNNIALRLIWVSTGIVIPI